MNPNNFVELLASVLPRKDISKVLNALRLNSLLWEDLGDKQFSDTLINWMVVTGSIFGFRPILQ